MRLFVSEYICSGGWPEATLPESLAREGRAMLLALLEDAARNPQWDVHTTWDHRLGEFPHSGVSAQIVHNPEDEDDVFGRLTCECDAVYVIAPELDNLLLRRCQRVEEAGAESLNGAAPAIALCSDKLRLARRLKQANVPTVPTERLNSAPPCDFPVVVKPRFGAGSHETHLVETGRRFDQLRLEFADDPEHQQGIVQPYVKGMPVSIVVFVNDQGRTTDLGPIVEQLLSVDGRFTYLGGRIPAGTGCDDAVRQLATDSIVSVPGLRGYVGIDMLIPYQRREPLVVDINPRLTTSYVGYRALTPDNLALRILQPDTAFESIEWIRNPLLFTSQGSVNHTHR